MARVKNNIITQGMSGTVNGQLVFKTLNNKTFTTKKPDMSKVKLSNKQKAENNRFKEAIAYAKNVISNPTLKAEMAKRTPKGRLIYHQAVAEYMAAHKIDHSLT